MIANLGHALISERPLHLSLLGTPVVYWEAEPLSVSRKKVRALLYYLASTQEPTSREQLTFLFWPDLDEGTARRNLSHLLTHLRRALPERAILQVTEENVYLNPERFWCDVLSFTELCAHAGIWRRIEAFEQAISLYRGLFLEGFALDDNPEYDTWLSRKRRTLEGLYLETLADTMQVCLDREIYDKAIACAERYLRIDELSEDIHRHLIALYALSGNRSAALRQFERCAAILERELNVSPLPETRAVYQAVLEGRSPLLAKTLSTIPRSTLFEQYSPIPLIGREDALRFLLTNVLASGGIYTTGHASMTVWQHHLPILRDGHLQLGGM